MEYLSNGILEIEISPLGAELQRIRRVTAPWEYLWQGDAAYWNRRSPILFPNVGKVWNSQVIVDGQPCELHQHGFARDMPFKKIIDEDRHMAFLLRSNETTHEFWPFDFELRIDYTLLRNTITVGWSLTNCDTRTMPFQIGAHPGFNYPHYSADDDLHGYLSFNVSDALVSTAIATGGYAGKETFEVPLPEDGLLPLTNDTFACDTIVDATGRINRITLHDKNAKPLVTICHSMPITALWSPCNGRAPFVCIEPWHGRCDDAGFEGEFLRRPFIEQVAPGQTWNTNYEMIIE
ncbi:MAG: aldose 1-epimerase family protein [Bacteroidales bacterium]|nr:aldose 1-epimerase family protein [Bacteroidales bacterium]